MLNDIEIHFEDSLTKEEIKEFQAVFPILQTAVDEYGSSIEIVSWPTMLEDIKKRDISFIVREFRNSYQVTSTNGVVDVLQISSN